MYLGVKKLTHLHLRGALHHIQRICEQTFCRYFYAERVEPVKSNNKLKLNQHLGDNQLIVN